jgi:transcriptional regulator with XRE-family HTH domain
MAATRKYAKQRQPKVPPHVSLKHVRAVSGLTIEQLIERIAKKCDGYKTTKGAISGLENGHRGGSEQLLRAIENRGRPRAGRLMARHNAAYVAHEIGKTEQWVTRQARTGRLPHSPRRPLLLLGRQRPRRRS